MASQQFAHKLLYFVRLLNIKTEATNLDSSFKKKEKGSVAPIDDQPNTQAESSYLSSFVPN